MAHRTLDQTEEQLHRQVVEFLRGAIPEGQGVFWTHFPAGGKRPRGEAGKMKGLGTKAGVPDLLFWHAAPPGYPRTFAIELKSETGRLTGSQVETQFNMKQAGCETLVCRSLREVADVLGVYQVPMRARVAA